MSELEITFNDLPKMVVVLSNKIDELKTIVESQKVENLPTQRNPISIEKACEIVKKAKPTLYTLVRKRQIPHYKNGKKLYFYEEELLEWIAKGKRKTIQEIEEIVSQNRKRLK